MDLKIIVIIFSLMAQMTLLGNTLTLPTQHLGGMKRTWKETNHGVKGQLGLGTKL